MEFIQVFISEVAEGEQSLDTAAGKPLLPSHNPKHVCVCAMVSRSGVTMFRNCVRQDTETVSQLDCQRNIWCKCSLILKSKLRWSRCLDSLPLQQLAVKAVPYYQDFMNQLGSDGSAQANEAVLQDMATFAASLGHLVRLIGTFYVDHKLDNLPSVD